MRLDGPRERAHREKQVSGVADVEKDPYREHLLARQSKLGKI